MKTVICCAAMGALLSVASAPAQELSAAPPLPITLEAAVRRGLETSHRIAEAAARGDAAAAVADQRHAAALPQIAALAGYTRTNHVDAFGILLPANQLRIIYPDIPDNYRTRLDLQWPIYTGGRVDALERAARIDATASADDVEAARRDLRLDVTRAFWAFDTAVQTEDVVNRSSARIDAHLKDVRNQLDAGLVPPSDVFTVDAQAARQRMLMVQARSNREVAEAEFARLVGVPPGTRLVTARGEPLAPAPATIEALAEVARQQRPERAALLKRLDAAAQRTRAASAGTRPTVAVGGGVDYASPNPRIFPREDAWRTSWDASVNVNWPLFDGGRARGEMAEAAAQKRAVQERLADFDASLEVEIRQRLSEIASSRAAIASADDAVRSATEAHRVLGERFAAGVATSTDVLDAQIALLQAQLDRTQAIANAHLADARLTRAAGR